MDNGVIPTQVRTELKEELFLGNEEDTNKKIKLVPVSEIENLFNQKDLLLIDSTIKEDNKKTQEVIDLVNANNGVQYAKEKMIAYQNEAFDILYKFPESEARTGLEQLVRYTTERKK